MRGIQTVSFFGHRQVENFFFIEQQIEKIIRGLVVSSEYVEFLVGRNGEFDQLVSSVIRRVKKQVRDDNNCHTLVLPYETALCRENREAFAQYYDQIEISSSGMTHFKAAFQKRNREMVDRSDLIVFYIEKENGGAYQTYQYAVKKEKPTVILSVEK